MEFIPCFAARLFYLQSYWWLNGTNLVKNASGKQICMTGDWEVCLGGNCHQPELL